MIDMENYKKNLLQSASKSVKKFTFFKNFVRIKIKNIRKWDFSLQIQKKKGFVQL